MSIGNAGTVIATASDSIVVSGRSAINKFIPSFIGSIASSIGSAGQVSIKTKKIALYEGGRLYSSTLAAGSANALSIDASDSIDINSDTFDPQFASGIFSSATYSEDPFLNSFLRLPNILDGESRSIFITTGKLNIRNGGLISVQNDGKIRSGTLQLNADLIQLNNSASIIATTFFGQGGEINLDTQNLQLRQNSSISASVIGGSGGGGNITINTGTLTALENSDISADALGGSGGRVSINTQGLFGTQYRNGTTSNNDITASSGIGLNGTVDIRSLGFDVTNTLTPLTGNLVSTEQIVANSCLTRRNATSGSFVISGSGGLPTNPYSGVEAWEPLSGMQPGVNNMQQRRSLSLSLSPASPEKTSQIPSSHKWKMGEPIVEAQGMTKTADGRLLLGMVPEAAPHPTEELVCPTN